MFCDYFKFSYITSKNNKRNSNGQFVFVPVSEIKQFTMTSDTSELDLTLTSDPCLVMNLEGHTKPITDIVFSPDNKQFTTSSEDCSLMVWNISEKIRSYKFTGHTDTITSVDYSKDGKLASSSKDHTVRMWTPTIRGGSSYFQAHTSAVNCVSFNVDSSKLVTCSNDKSIKLWDASKRQFIMSCLGHNNWVKCAKTSVNDDLIVSCSDDRTVRVWCMNTGQQIHVFHNSSSCPTYLALHRNNNSIAVAHNSGSVRVYDIRNKKLQQHYTLHDYTTCVAWHPWANYLLSSGKDGKLRIIDVMEGRPLYTLTGHDKPVFSCKFSQNGEYFASAGADKCVMVWKTNFVTTDC